MKFITDWFKPKDKRNVVIPATETGPLRGVELICAFTTEDEPKVKDFPKEKYKVYWEIYVDAIPGGYGALVRFYSFKDGFVQEHQIARQGVSELREEVSKLILRVMEDNKV